MVPFLGFPSLIVLAVVIALAAWGASSFVGRALEVGPFELFDARRPPTLWKECLVRIAGVIVTYFVAAGVFTVGGLVGGEVVPTSTVNVRPGPAKDAGMQDGDKVVEIDGRAIGSWEEIMGAVRDTHEAHDIVVERDGQRVHMSVTPNEAGRISIESRYDRRPATFAGAVALGFPQPFRAVTSVMRTIVKPPKTTELSGPVGIVRETRNEGVRAGAVFWILGMCGAFAWPALLLMHTVDMATLPSFLRKYPVRPDEDPRVWLEPRRIARRRRVLNFLLAFWALAVGYVMLVDVANLGTGAAVNALLWLSPLFFFVVAWHLARSLWGRGPAILSLVAMCVPCLNVLFLVYLSARAGARVRETGVEARRPEPRVQF
jgi:membrane-associated protease RseP (regulator of RpoE activity)